MKKDIWTEKKRRRKRKEDRKLGFKATRINPDREKFNIHAEIGKTYNHINESNKKLTEESTKKSLTDEILRRLLELEFGKVYC